MSRAVFFLRLGVLLAVLAFGWRLLPRDPLSTPLPSDPRELDTASRAFERLNLEEKDLVVHYAERSNGQVLPKQFADPEDPLTARTFGEAIELQRAFEQKQASNRAAMEARDRARQEQLAPLREVLTVELVKREIVSRTDFLHRGFPSGAPTTPSDDPRVLVTTYRVRNRSSEPIAHYSGNVTVHRVGDPRTGLAARTSCFLEESTALEPDAERDHSCGDLAKPATHTDEEFVALPQSAAVVTWEPRDITFESGRRLAATE